MNIPGRYTLLWSQSPVLVLIAALVMLSGTRAFDCFRAMSYCVRTRRGAAVALQRIDQTIEEGRLLARAGSISIGPRR